MLSVRKYLNYLVLGYLAMAVVCSPTWVGAVVLNSASPSTQIAQNPSAANTTDEAQIKTALLEDAKKQSWQPKIGTITIADGYAIATTYDEVAGGESVLRKHLGAWKVIGGTGGAFSQPEELVQFAKVPLATARHLLKIRAKQER